MTTKRRSLNAALDMSAEHSAFIRGGLPAETQVQSPKQPPQEAPILLRTEVAKPKVQYEVVEANEPDEPINWSEREEGTKTAVTTTKRNRPRTTRREQSTNDEVMLGMANLLVPLTTRLSPLTAAALKRAGLEQKLYGRQPSTVQEIAEDAIKKWLNVQGYL